MSASWCLLFLHSASCLAARLHCSSLVQSTFTCATGTRAPVVDSILFCFPQQARAEQEEEFISNTLFKKIQALQKEKETLAVNYEKEEEFLTNELSRKLMQVRASWLGLRPEPPELPCAGLAAFPGPVWMRPSLRLYLLAAGCVCVCVCE